ncbi:glycoside hydrolase family 9 protein [Natronospora cellulosivora (SeqCode)]
MFKKSLKFLVIVLALTLCFSVVYAENLLRQGDFEDGALPWELFVNSPNAASGRVENGEYVVTVNDPGTQGWHIQLRHRGLTIEEGHTYTISFKVRASKDAQVYAKVGMAGDPYHEFWNNSWSAIDLPAGEIVEIEQTFTMTDPTHNASELGFHLGGNYGGDAPYTVAFDDIVLWDDQYTRPPEWEDVELSDIRANQTGYLPNAVKRATVISDSNSSLNWELKDNTGRVVYSGQTQRFGFDPASGDNVHIIDFSSFEDEGENFTLSVGNSESFPFDISENVYRQLRYDAFSYFYHNRSGIDITMPYAGGEEWTRPAGHVPDIAEPGPGVEGNYTIDATGGWYDAGDHGKYVVNGGISVWTVMNQYERTLYAENASTEAVADGAMNIPESNNGYPDILDEARWQMEMLLNMQVPEGYPMAGMAVHKLHNPTWTSLPLAPHEDTNPRIFMPPSTAATLNLAAVAAQSARLWEEFDPAFAAECLTVAERAWEAAQQYPSVYAPTANSQGGGAYSDSNVQDEFYWAAAELFITTGENEYLNFIQSSPYYLSVANPLSSGSETEPFSWQSTGALGTVSLALVPNNLNANDLQTARQNIINAADEWIDVIDNEGYGTPLRSYYWGSNSVALNKGIFMAYAHDFTNNDKYFDGAVQAMDYVLGRNALSQSYVTGYGVIVPREPHHRFWANSIDRNYPLPPPGVLAGGANSNLQDSVMTGGGFDNAAPQECYVDHIDSYSTNEVTINWNAPLAWLAAYLDDMSGEGTTPPEVLIGDVNDDGVINSLDYTVLTRYLVGHNVDINYEAADVNFDNLINSLDAVVLGRYLLGEITEF